MSGVNVRCCDPGSNFSSLLFILVLVSYVCFLCVAGVCGDAIPEVAP